MTTCLTTSRRHSVRRCESGAVMLEMTLVFIPLLLIWMIGFDIGFVLVETSMIKRAHFSAARLGALQHTDCTGTAHDSFDQQLNSMGLGRPFDDHLSGTITVDGIRGFNFQVSLETRCLACVLFPGMRDAINYRSGTFYPYEDQAACS